MRRYFDGQYQRLCRRNLDVMSMGKKATNYNENQIKPTVMCKSFTTDWVLRYWAFYEGYWQKNGGHWLKRRIDSAVVACFLRKLWWSGNVYAVNMPSKFKSDLTKEPPITGQKLGLIIWFIRFRMQLT